MFQTNERLGSARTSGRSSRDGRRSSGTTRAGRGGAGRRPQTRSQAAAEPQLRESAFSKGAGGGQKKTTTRVSAKVALCTCLHENTESLQFASWGVHGKSLNVRTRSMRGRALGPSWRLGKMGDCNCPLYARHCSQYSKWINLFSPHNNSMRYLLTSSSFHR